MNVRVIRAELKLNDLVFGADMEERRDFEAWALARAYEIVTREGHKLVLSAQNLDKKSTKDSSYQLLRAIADSLLEVRTKQTAA